MGNKKKMVICRNCNTPIEKQTKICPACGAKNKPPFYKKWWFILLVVIVVIGIYNSADHHKKQKIVWSDVELGDKLPKPESKTGDIIINTSDELKMYVEKTSKGDYKKYIESCISMGYTVESEKEGDSYQAFDEEGYALSLDYMSDRMHVELEAPIEMGKIKWPKSEIASLLPKPKSLVGEVVTDTSEECLIYIGKISIDAFNDYADECSNQGFSVDYQREEKNYSAKDESGNELLLNYEGNKVMSIQIKKAEEEESEEKDEASQEEAKETTTKKESEKTKKSDKESKLVDGMRPEFKKAMDSYEDFMNEYCKFMKKYANSDGKDLGLLSDYAKYMAKYEKAAKDFEAWDDEELNNAEMEYYLDVQNRINKKLLEVQPE